MNIEEIKEEANNLSKEDLYELAEFCTTLAGTLQIIEG